MTLTKRKKYNDNPSPRKSENVILSHFASVTIRSSIYHFTTIRHEDPKKVGRDADFYLLSAVTNFLTYTISMSRYLFVFSFHSYMQLDVY